MRLGRRFCIYRKAIMSSWTNSVFRFRACGRAFLFMLLFPAFPLWAAEQPAAIGGTVRTHGIVKLISADGSEQVPREGTPVYAGQRVETGADGWILLRLADDTTLSLASESSVALDEFIYDPETHAGSVQLNLLKGISKFISGKIVKKDPARMKVKLPVAYIGIRGTAFIADVNQDRSVVVLLESVDENGAVHSGHIFVAVGEPPVEAHLRDIGCSVIIRPGSAPETASSLDNREYLHLAEATAAGEPVSTDALLAHKATVCSASDENTAENRAAGPDVEAGMTPKPRAAAAEQSQSPLTTSTPTIPLPPPILPSFYDTPQRLDAIYAGRSLSYVFAVCGDGSYDPGEDCDDGNRSNGDGCSDMCTLEDPLSCGNGRIDPGERCDDGNIADGDGCSATCQPEGACGDGRVDPGEQCDDGNRSNGDGCSATCLKETANPKKEPSPVYEPPPDKKPSITPSIEPLKEPTDPVDEPMDPIKDEPKVTYEPGRAITNIAGCTGTCTMEVKRDADGRIISTREIVSERKIDPGSTYTHPVYGEISCATGRSVDMSESSKTRNEEAPATLTAAEIVGCSL